MMRVINFVSSASNTKDFLDLIDSLRQLAIKLSEDMVLIRVDIKVEITLEEVD